MTREFVWNRPQRAVVASGVLALSIFFGVMCCLRPEAISDPQPVDGARATELLGRLDPNVASVGDLSAIPNLGEKRAHAIVVYRDLFKKRHAGEMAFHSADDLIRVDGIGAATAANIEPFVTFGAGAIRK